AEDQRKKSDSIQPSLQWPSVLGHEAAPHTRMGSGSSSSPCTPAPQRAMLVQCENFRASKDVYHSSSLSDMVTTPLRPVHDDVFWSMSQNEEQPPKVPERTTSKFYSRDQPGHQRCPSSNSHQSSPGGHALKLSSSSSTPGNKQWEMGSHRSSQATAGNPGSAREEDTSPQNHLQLHKKSEKVSHPGRVASPGYFTKGKDSANSLLKAADYSSSSDEACSSDEDDMNHARQLRSSRVADFSRTRVPDGIELKPQSAVAEQKDQILGKPIPSTQEGLWSINNQNYLLPDLLQQSQISDSSVNPPKVPLTGQEPQNKLLTKTPCPEGTTSKSSTSSTTSFTSFIDPRLLPITPPTSPVGPSCSSPSSAKPEPVRRENARKGSVVNVNPTNIRPQSDSPEIRKYKKKFNSEVLCAALWGVNLLVGTENGLWLLDRSGQGRVYSLITRRRFQQMDVLEGLNVLITISGKKNKLRVYYLSWLRNKILRNDPEVEKRQGWVSVGDLEGCVHYKVVKYERIKFLVIALKNSVEVYAWAPKPYHKFMAFKSFTSLHQKPLSVDLTIENGQRLKVIYGSVVGFHAIDVDSGSVYDLYLPTHIQGTIRPHAIIILPNTSGMELLLTYEDEGIYIDIYGHFTKETVLQWGEMPASVAYLQSNQVMGWGEKAIELRSVETGNLEGVFMHKKAQKLKFLCERNDKVFFASVQSGGSSQIYFMTLGQNVLFNW
ncbi:PREDICTED: mitogen-activated protein kinase kinase kinase kinase 4-like, partial [Mesitornis unicolor]|uniref:mitogen-activated protein kinase kinase kinase kinase 4-like n=1 Tax=Mesitornis unicolor TaxID=54374 RepID=UPI0005280A9C